MIISTHSYSQLASPAGIYYLEGVMETASGYKLNPDSTFEFFFSQGALDRTGSGNWSMADDRIILNSPGKPGTGFILQKSEKSSKKKITVVVKESNSMLLSFIYVRPVSKTETEFLKMGTDGVTELDPVEFTGIEFYFEICPEKTYSFKPLHAGDNYLEFTIDPSIMDVHFDNLPMMLKGKTLSGKHPLLRGDSFDFVKQE